MSFGRNFSISENTSYKIVALLITIILWIVILGSKESSLIKMVPTEYILPKDMMIVNSVPHEVGFRIAGPRLALKRYTEVTDPLTIDLSSALEGMTTVRIHPDSINVPSSIRVFSVAPSVVTPHLERVVSRVVPVQVAVKGELKNNKHLLSITPDPDTFEVTGARSVIEHLKFIKTIPINLDEINETKNMTVPLAVDMPGLIREEKAQVSVDIVIN